MSTATITPGPATIGGFAASRPTRRRRIVMAIAGLDKCGKTFWGLSAPAPMAVANTDTGLEGVIEQFERQGKRIYSKDYRVVVPAGADANSIAGVANKVWDEYKSDMRAAWQSPHIRTTIADTETDTWQLCRLARFGKLTQVMPHHYGPVNAEYAGFWNEVYNTDKNLILLRKMKEEYDEQNKRYTGKFKSSGYNDMNYLVQVNCVVRHTSSEGFSIEVVNCRQNASLQGAVLSGDMCNFVTLAMMVHPDSDESDWI